MQDVLYYAGGARSAPKQVLAEKLEHGRTPVYNYVFAWEYPIDGGTTAFHCSELAFCFHAGDVPQIHNATGGGPVAMALQAAVRSKVTSSAGSRAVASPVAASSKVNSPITPGMPRARLPSTKVSILKAAKFNAADRAGIASMPKSPPPIRQPARSGTSTWPSASARSGGAGSATD